MTLAVIIASYLLPGVSVSSVWVAILTAVVISLLNSFIRPILIVVTLPFTIISMGLFLFVINAVMVMLASGIVSGFNVGGFGNALIFSLLLTLLNYLLELPNKLMQRKNFEPRDDNNDDTDDEGFTPYEEVD